MKTKITAFFATLALVAATTFAVSNLHAQEKPEHHPAIRRAITALKEAKTYLQAANHDFGGHRAEALAECDKALEQLQLALQFDKK